MCYVSVAANLFLGKKALNLRGLHRFLSRRSTSTRSVRHTGVVEMVYRVS